jgi:hypothetical protein
MGIKLGLSHKGKNIDEGVRTGGWRRLHSEKLHKLNVSPNIIRVIKSRWMRQVRHCSVHIRFWLENVKGKENMQKI